MLKTKRYKALWLSFLTLMVVLYTPSIMADVDFGYNSIEVPNLQPELSTVNNTHNTTQMYDGGGVFSILPGWVISLFNDILWTADFNATGDGRWGGGGGDGTGAGDLYINETGDTMRGNFTLKNETVKINDANNNISIFFENGVFIVEG